MKSIIALPQMSLGAALYLLHRVLDYCIEQYKYTVFRWYFADTLALIVCVPLFVNIEICFIQREHYISITDILMFFVWFVIKFEILLPMERESATRDLFDIVAYAVGGCILYCSQDLKKQTLETQSNTPVSVKISLWMCSNISWTNETYGLTKVRRTIRHRSMSNLLIRLIRVYQNLAPVTLRRSCRFEPSCSNYMILAIGKYGVLQGVCRGIQRILRCRVPNGGIDYP